MKRALIILIGILVVVISFVLLLLNPIAENYLTKKIEEVNLEGMELSYDSLTVSILKNEFEFKNLSLIQKNGKFEIAVNSITIEGISYSDLILSGELKIDSVKFQKPISRFDLDIKIDSMLNQQNKRNTSDKNVKSINIENLAIVNGFFELKKKEKLNTFKKINLEFNDLKSELSDVSLQTINYSYFQGSIDSSQLSFLDYHTTNCESIQFSKNGGVSMAQFEVSPINEFRKGKFKLDYRVDWLTLDLDSLHFELDWYRLVKEQYLDINDLEIYQLNLDNYSDKRFVKKSEEPSLLPDQLIHSVGMQFNIDSLELANCNIVYREKSEKGNEGRVEFAAINGKIKNITNDSILLALDKNMTMGISSKLMAHSKLNVNIVYDLLSNNSNHHITGSLSDFELSKLNPVFKPLALLEFQSGNLKKLEFDFYCNRSNSEGIADFMYDDLKVVIYEDKKIFKPGFLGKIETLLANTFLIRKSNPLRGNYKQGSINFERDLNKSTLNYWWKSVFSGMKSTILTIDK